MTSFKTTAYIETTETQLQGVVDAIMGKDLSAWVCDYPFGAIASIPNEASGSRISEIQIS